MGDKILWISFLIARSSVTAPALPMGLAENKAGWGAGCLQVGEVPVSVSAVVTAPSSNTAITAQQTFSVRAVFQPPVSALFSSSALPSPCYLNLKDWKVERVQNTSGKRHISHHTRLQDFWFCSDLGYKHTSSASLIWWCCKGQRNYKNVLDSSEVDTNIHFTDFPVFLGAMENQKLMILVLTALEVFETGVWGNMFRFQNVQMSLSVYMRI